jgi:branched-chain amino acid transport system substrate-binding protein
MKKFVALFLIVSMLLCFVSAGFAEPAGEPIKIGLSGMSTGDYVESGLLMQNGVLLAAEEINANGGLLGRPVEIVFVDNASTAQGAVTSVNKILSEDVVACIGPTTSGMVNATLQYFQDGGIPFVSAATSPAIRNNESDCFFRISVSDALVGTVMVKFAAETLKATKIGIIHNTDDYGMAAMNAAVEAAKNYGIETYTEGMTSADTDVSAQLLKIKSWGADCIFSFTHDADTVLVVRQLHELGMRDINYVGPNALPMPANIPLIDSEALAGCYASTDYFADVNDAKLQDYIARYAERWDGLEVDRLAALYYTATYVVADAIARAGSDNPAEIKAAMEKTSGLETVLGSITCDENHDLNSTLFIVLFDETKECSLAEKVTLN